MSKSNQFRVCELILLSVPLVHRYILHDSWNYPRRAKAQCILITHIVHTYYAVHIRRKMFRENLSNWTVCVAPNIARTWTCSVWLPCIMRGSAAEHVYVSHSDFQPGRSQRQSAHQLGESRPKIIDKVDHWRVKLKAVVWLNGGHIKQLFWLLFICCRSLLCSVCLLRTFVHLAIVYRALRIRWYCDKK